MSKSFSIAASLARADVRAPRPYMMSVGIELQCRVHSDFPKSMLGKALGLAVGVRLRGDNAVSFARKMTLNPCPLRR